MAEEFVPNPRPAATVLTGVRETNTVLASRIKYEVDEEIIWLMPSAAPLTTLSTAVKKSKETSQVKFVYMEKGQFPREVTLASALLSGGVTATLSTGHGDRGNINGLFQHAVTGEVILITALPATDQWTIVRGIGSTPQQMEAGDVLSYISNSYEEGSDIGTPKSTKEEEQYNYVQIVRDSVGVTGTMDATETHGGNDMAIARKAAGIEHQKNIEGMLYFGRRHVRVGTGGKLQHMTGGLEYFISTNVWDLGGTSTPTKRAFQEFLEAAMKHGKGGTLYGNSTKHAVMSGRWKAVIHDWIEDKVEYRPLDGVIGFKATKFVSPFGTVIFWDSPFLDEYRPDTMLIVDMGHIRRRHLKGRNTKLLKDRQNNGMDTMLEEYLSHVGWQVELEESHAIVKGLPL